MVESERWDKLWMPLWTILYSLTFLLEEIVNKWRIMAKEFHGKYDILSVVEKMDQSRERITINASKTMPPNLDFLGYKESQSNGELSRSIKMLILFYGLFE